MWCGVLQWVGCWWLLPPPPSPSLPLPPPLPHVQSDVGGAKLKDLMVDQGLVKLCVDYIRTHVPPAT